MTTPNRSFLRPVLNRSLAVALACSFGIPLLPIQAVGAPAMGTLSPLDDHLQPVPMTSSVDKADGDNGPYVLTLKNTSNDSIRASGTVQLSVASHGDKKTRDIAEHVVGRAEVWTIPGLSAGDKVTITAEGYSPLVIPVP
jgi:hypothetical protein